MNVRRIFSVPEHGTPGVLALLAVRLVAGLAFTLHGWPKIQDPFGWMGADAFAPPIFQGLAALSEFGGGLAWMFGLLTPLASLGLAATMVVATWTLAVTYAAPFVPATEGPGYELPLVYLCVALLLIALGPGRLSLDRWLFGRR